MGLGVSVSVNTIENVVQAQVSGGHLNSAGAIKIAADSDETLDPLVMTAGVGAVGVAGTVAVNNIQTTTEAIDRKRLALRSESRPGLQIGDRLWPACRADGHRQCRRYGRS